jgi:hypothetical protein
MQNENQERNPYFGGDPGAQTDYNKPISTEALKDMQTIKQVKSKLLTHMREKKIKIVDLGKKMDVDDNGFITRAEF